MNDKLGAASADNMLSFVLSLEAYFRITVSDRPTRRSAVRHLAISIAGGLKNHCTDLHLLPADGLLRQSGPGNSFFRKVCETTSIDRQIAKELAVRASQRWPCLTMSRRCHSSPAMARK
jgi:hypothetical protein